MFTQMAVIDVLATEEGHSLIARLVSGWGEAHLALEDEGQARLGKRGTLLLLDACLHIYHLRRAFGESSACNGSMGCGRIQVANDTHRSQEHSQRQYWCMLSFDDRCARDISEERGGFWTACRAQVTGTSTRRLSVANKSMIRRAVWRASKQEDGGAPSSSHRCPGRICHS